MKQLLRECRECWMVTTFITVLFIANGVDMWVGVQNHSFHLPLILRSLEFLH